MGVLFVGIQPIHVFRLSACSLHGNLVRLRDLDLRKQEAEKDMDSFPDSSDNSNNSSN